MILKYLTVAIYLTVSSIFANKMDLPNLTYFNAIITLTVFAELIGFGISNGISLYINQNYKNKNKASRYGTAGNFITIAIGILFILILILGKDFFLHSMLDLPTSINYNFFYLMLIYILFDCIFSYLINIIKSIKLFKPQLVLSLIQSILMIVGFIIVWLASSMSLIYIPIVYIISILACTVIAYIVLKHNKTLNITMFTFSFKLNKKEILNIFQFTFQQLFWQVGYFLVSLVLLKTNEIIFNQYSYYENVLDIFNGLFFSFIIVSSITICRELGEEKFDEAYKHGKYSIYASIVIWLIYFILSSAFIIPINMGMNIELQSTAFISMFLYVGMHLFRFISWNLSSYVLCWGGDIKPVLMGDILSVIYFSLIYTFSNYIPNNMFLIYFIIAFDIILTPYYLYLFKKKRWIRNVNYDDVKVVIFDFDETLYSGVDFSPWDEFCKKGLKKILKDDSYNEELENSDESIISILKAKNIPVKKWLDYRDKNNCVLNYNNAIAIKDKELKKFAKNKILYIVSNSTEKDIRNVARIMNIDLNCFKEIITNSFKNDISKKPLYEEIMKKEQLEPNDILVIGNSYISDIAPAKELGMYGKVIKNADIRYHDLF